LSKVNWSAMTARQPSVPNVMGAVMRRVLYVALATYADMP
jgi:hypothetical protein